MSRTSLSLAVAAFAVSAGTLTVLPAQAHIGMTGALKSRNGDAFGQAQKMYPCDGNRGDGPVYTFAPGTTITLALDEVIPHPSYYRIAFDNDGDDDFAEPLSIDPIEKSRACPLDANDKCGESDYCSFTSTDGASVLWDNLEPHSAGQKTSYSWNVKLPDIECDNCTIQIIQVMEDTIHGSYCVHGDSCPGDTSAPDIYHRCIDIKLVKGTKNGDGATTAPVSNKGMQCAVGDAPPPPPPDAQDDAGATPADPGGETNDPDAPPTDQGGSSARDAGSSASGGSTKKDAGTKDSGTKTSTGKDAGSSTDDGEQADGGDSGGCAVAPGERGMLGGALSSLLAIGALLGRRRRFVG